jgi:hypothetical protein
MKPRLLGKVHGLQNTSISVATLVHRKPILPFVVPVQVFVDRNNNLVEDESQGKPTMIGCEFHFQIDPTKITPTLNNYVAAAQARYSTASRADERFMASIAAAQGGGNTMPSRMTQDDLPEVDLLVQVLKERDEAADKRLLACVVKDEDGNTAWDWVNENGETPNLTWELLEANPTMADAIQGALSEWLNFSQKSSAEATGTEKAGTTPDSTPTTPAVPSANSHGPSIAPEPTTPSMETVGFPNGTVPSR